jgi:hypothetical protein
MADDLPDRLHRREGGAGPVTELEPGHVIENAPWSHRIGLKAPRIDPRGRVEPAAILGAEAQGELSSHEAREMSEALKAAADQADQLDAAMIPHLEAALAAGRDELEPSASSS